MTEQLLYPPVPSRECGECYACCRYLTVNTPEFKKLPNVLCEHWKGGCTIYATAWPAICRTFFCGWRVFAQLSDDWRPDRSNILIRMLPPGPEGRGVDFNLLGPLSEAMTHELLNFLAALIEANFATYLVVPGPPGHSASKLLLNDGMAPAIASRNYAHAQAALTEAIRVCTNFPTEPMVLESNPAEQKWS